MTKPANDYRCRAWTFTINNSTFNDLDKLLETDCRYLCFGFEHDEVGTPHIQGYIYLNDAKTRAVVVKKHLPRAHVEASRGTVEHNQIYTSKEGQENWYSFGEPPTQGQAKWDQIEEAMADPKSNPHVYQQYNKMYRNLELSKKKDHKRILLTCSTKDMYKEAALYESLKKRVLLGSDIDTYDGHDVIFVTAYQRDWVMHWINGFPSTIKRGYELICLDPEIVVLLYKDQYDFEALNDDYSEFLTLDYECTTNEDTPDTPQEDTQPIEDLMDPIDIADLQLATEANDPPIRKSRF